MIKKLFSRFALVALTILFLFVLYFAVFAALVVAVYAWLVVLFPEAGTYIAASVSAVSWLIVVIAVLHAANRDMVPESKIPWILCIVALNLFGVLVYVTFSEMRPTRRARRRFHRLWERNLSYERPSFGREELTEKIGRWAAVSEALSTVTPASQLRGGTRTEFFPVGEVFLKRMLGDLERAEKFIFLEYFIIGKGKLWDAVRTVLEKKAAEGVEVRVMYDDVGSMGRLRASYPKTLKKAGIACSRFNRFVPIVSNVHNNRDHRKITVIDGKVGYTGGINLADEYVNETHPYGHWKDTAVRLEGEAVRDLTLLFLRLWDVNTNTSEDAAPYLPAPVPAAEDGFVQVYGSGPSPMYPRHLGEDVYLNILGGARRTVDITTPYLIIDYRLREALVLAAQRGVRVRILTPHIPDKRIPFALTRSNYLALIRGGVEIYEYSPGFVHAKSMVADGEIAVVGTINLDYRSFLYHFEDGVLMVGSRAVADLAADNDAVFSVSARQTEADAKRSVVTRVVCEIAKIFAPLF